MDESSKKLRFKILLGTALIILAFAAFPILMNVNGLSRSEQARFMSSGLFVERSSTQYGWPSPALSYVSYAYTPNSGPQIKDAEFCSRFSLSMAVMNIAFCAWFYGSSMWGSCRWWRRRNTPNAEKNVITASTQPPAKFQFHLSTALALTILAGIIMAFNFLPQIRREDSTFAPLRQTITRTAKEYGWPAPVATHVQYSNQTFGALLPETNQWQASYALGMGMMDLLFALALLLVMRWLCESWIRRQRLSVLATGQNLNH
jgi:hypothetical protein